MKIGNWNVRILQFSSLDLSKLGLKWLVLVNKGLKKDYFGFNEFKKDIFNLYKRKRSLSIKMIVI